jgi:spore coat protein JB
LFPRGTEAYEEEKYLYSEKSVAGMETANCSTQQGSLPGACASLAFPYIPMQGKNPKQYDRREALQQGTLFPGLDLPFHRELKSRFPAVNSALSELMALDFAVDELGLYLTTHADDKEALELYWNYIALAQEGRKRYQETYGPVLQTDITPGSYRWLHDPWPWDEGGNS